MPAAHVQNFQASTSLHLHRTSRASCIHTSPSLHLQLASRAPYLHASTPARLQCSSNAPHLHTSTFTRRQCDSGALYLHASPSLHLQRASRHPELHTSMSPHLHAYRTPPALHTSTFARLPSSIYPYLRIATPATRLQTSRSPSLYTSTPLPTARLQSYRTSKLHTTKLARLHTLKRTSSDQRVATSASRLQSSSSPYSMSTRLRRTLKTSRSYILYSSISPRLQCACSAPYLHVSPSMHLQRAFRAPELILPRVNSRSSPASRIVAYCPRFNTQRRSLMNQSQNCRHENANEHQRGSQTTGAMVPTTENRSPIQSGRRAYKGGREGRGMGEGAKCKSSSKRGIGVADAELLQVGCGGDGRKSTTS